MPIYEISLRNENSTLLKTAEFYEIKEGFVRLYEHDNTLGSVVEFAAYSCDEVLSIVLLDCSVEHMVNEMRKIGC